MQTQNITVKKNQVFDGETLLATFDNEPRAWSYKSMLEESAKPTPQQEYWSDVRDMAASIEAELNNQIKDGTRGESLREWLLDHIHESIDSAARVIYTRQAMECIMYSDNDGAYFEEFGDEGAVSDGAINWSVLAFSAFERDVIAQLDSNGVDVNNPGPKCCECDDPADEEKNGEWYCSTCLPEDEEDDDEQEEAAQ